MTKQLRLPELTLGVCYYPEHWPEALWKSDLARMEKLGIRRIRIAEFAWNLFEPSEGDYHFELFDEFLDFLQNTSMRAIIGTPTATPPAWLTETYPEVLNADADGTLYRHGMRRHYNYTSVKYQELTKKIVTALAEHYGHHPAVCGWQIDNELNCEIDLFFAESDHAAFRAYLQNKYHTLDALNEAWGTNFWSQTYTDWNQVYLRRPAVHNSSNPHLALDSKRFISDACIRYCRLQSDILRRLADPSQLITTNGIFRHIDYPRMLDQCLDYLCYDSYPAFGLSDEADDPLQDRLWSWNLSKVRAISPVFGIMEQQSGAGGWACRMALPTPKPGQMRLWTYQSIAHGADFISFFRWRTCSYGTEIYWHGLNNYDNEPNRRLEELAQLSAEFQNLKPVTGSRYQAAVAVISDYDNDWDGELDLWHGPMRKQSVRNFFAAATRSHTPLDQMLLDSNTTLEALSAYQALIYPHPTIITPEAAELLHAYVAQGGKLLIGARAGYKDANGQCPMQPMPGPLAALCGVKVVDFTKIMNYNANIRIGFHGSQQPEGFLDIYAVTAPEATVMGVYENDYCMAKPAVVCHPVGKGFAYSYGSGFTEAAAKEWLGELGLLSPLQSRIQAPESCELALREKDGKPFLFVLNYAQSCAALTLWKPMINLLDSHTYVGGVTLEGFGVMVLAPVENPDNTQEFQ